MQIRYIVETKRGVLDIVNKLRDALVAAQLITELKYPYWGVVKVAGLPQQQNGVDCGVYAISYMAYIAARKQDLISTYVKHERINILRSNIVRAMVTQDASHLVEQ